MCLPVVNPEPAQKRRDGMREFVGDNHHGDDDFDFEERVRQQERRDRNRRQARRRMQRYRARLRAKKEQAEAIRPKRRSIDYQGALFDNPNYGVFSLTQRRILDILVQEHARHFGTRVELRLTYNAFVAGGGTRRLIKPALTKLEALDVVSVTWGLGGRKGRVANRFRLVFIDGRADASVTRFGATSSTDERYARCRQRNAWSDWSHPWRSWVKRGIERERQARSRPTSGTAMADTILRRGFGDKVERVTGSMTDAILARGAEMSAGYAS